MKREWAQVWRELSNGDHILLTLKSIRDEISTVTL